MTRRYLWWGFLALALMSGLVACRGGDDTPEPLPPIMLVPANAQVIAGNNQPVQLSGTDQEYEIALQSAPAGFELLESSAALALEQTSRCVISASRPCMLSVSAAISPGDYTLIFEYRRVGTEVTASTTWTLSVLARPEIDFSEDSLETPVGVPVTLVPTVQNIASANSVRWEVSGGTLNQSPTEIRASFSANQEGEYTVTISSVDVPDVRDTITVNVVRPALIEVTPTDASVLPGETVEFRANVLGLLNPAVTWSAARGQINNSGTGSAIYTAPNQPGQDTITATSAQDPNETTSVTVTVLEPTVTITISPENPSVAAGDTVQFNAQVTGSNDSSVRWQANGGTISSSGLYTAFDIPGTYTITASSTQDATATTSTTVTVLPPPVQVRISPRSVNLLPGGEQTFSADVFNSNDTSVTWQTDEGGGSITAEGIYTAPDTPGSYVVTAISNADNNRTDSVIVQVSQPNTISVDITPAEVSLEPTDTQPFTALVSGSDNTEVIWRVITTQNNQIIERNDLVDADGVFTAPSEEGTYYIEAISQADPSKRAQAIAIVARPNQPIDVDISVAPATATLAIGDTQRFQATVTGTGDTGVTWRVLESNGGTINESGTYTAPATAGTYTVTATSVASPNASASATVTVIEPQQDVSVSVSPSNAQLLPEETLQLTAEVTGTANQAVTWQAFVLEDGSEIAIDTVSDSGVFTAPNRAGEYLVRATSDADPSKQASAALVVSATLTIDPASVRLSPGSSQQFSATISGLEDDSVDWQASAGSISDSGFYVAPNSEGNYTVTATSRADDSLVAEASVSVGEPIIVTLRPGDIQVRPGDSQQFSVTVENAASDDVNWQVLEASGGTVTETGLYTAPSQPGVYTLQATSVSDATASDSITVYVTNVTSIQATARPSSILPGASSTLTVTVLGDEPFNSDVTWSFFAGSGLGTLSNTSGNEITFTSNGRTGLVIIQATSLAAPRIGDSVTIFVEDLGNSGGNVGGNSGDNPGGNPGGNLGTVRLDLPNTTTTLIKGEPTTITGSVDALDNYSGSLDLMLLEPPPELSATFSPTRVDLTRDESATFTLTLNLPKDTVPSGNQTYTVEVSDSTVRDTASFNVTILEQEPVAPTLTWQSPQPSSTVTSSPVTLEVDLDPGTADIDDVQFYVDDTFLNRDLDAPYSATWETIPADNGSHTLRADVRYSFDGEVFETLSETITITTDLSTAPLTEVARVAIPGSNNVRPVSIGSSTYLTSGLRVARVDAQNNLTTSDPFNPLTALATDGNSLFALSSQGVVYRLSADLASRSVSWSANNNQTLISSQSAIANAGGEVFAAYGREVRALNAGWTVSFRSYITAITATTVNGQPRLFAASGNILKAYDANGQELASIEIEAARINALAADGNSGRVWVLTFGAITPYSLDLSSNDPTISGACSAELVFGNDALWSSGGFGCLKRLAVGSNTPEPLLSSSAVSDRIFAPTFSGGNAYARSSTGTLYTFGNGNQQVDLIRILGQPTAALASDRLYITSRSTGDLHIFQLLN